ncbi:MAG TPA: nitronate monooxygenase [Pseudomonadales bacterium]
MTFDTAFTRRFGLRVPVVQAPMAGVAGPELVAAAANAGALGILPIWAVPAAEAVALIRRTRALTSRPFAVNVRADLAQHEHVAAALAEGIELINLFWADPTPTVEALQPRRFELIATVWDADSARRALAAGAVALIAQGVEAGGHVRGTVPLATLLPEVCTLAGDVPVAAAGGLAEAADVAAVLALGAGAAVLGTRFVATAEADAHDAYKHALVDAGDGSTVLSTCFDGLWPDAPHRTLANSTWRAWEAAGRPAAGARPGEVDVVLRDADGTEYPRYSAMLPTREMTGAIEAAALYAGTGVGRIRRVPTVADVVDELTAALSDPAAAGAD